MSALTPSTTYGPQAANISSESTAAYLGRPVSAQVAPYEVVMPNPLPLKLSRGSVAYLTHALIDELVSIAVAPNTHSALATLVQTVEPDEESIDFELSLGAFLPKRSGDIDLQVSFVGRAVVDFIDDDEY